jgi:predicted metalloprotease
VKWRRGRGADQIEDRRGLGGLAGLGAGAGGLGVVGLILVLVFTVFSGGGFDPRSFKDIPPLGGTGTTSPDPDANLKEFVAFVVADVQASWTKAFQTAGETYAPTTLVLFEQATQSGCGFASSQTGPFYCPTDRKVYLDLGFFRQLRDRFGAPGDFAQAYVIAHEFGHHVQNVLGISDDVRREQEGNPDRANELSILLELQADCLSGAWAHSAEQRKLLEEGDLEEGLAAAAAVGDDRIQKEATGRIDRESWTHGSSEQRMTWFKRGFARGAIAACDTFAEA